MSLLGDIVAYGIDVIKEFAEGSLYHVGLAM